MTDEPQYKLTRCAIWFRQHRHPEAIGSMCGADYSLTVYQPKDFDPANPVYKVKVWDKSGEQAGNGFPPPTTGHHIFSVHTAAPSKGAAGFFYSAHFYLIPGHIKEGKAVSL